MTVTKTAKEKKARGRRQPPGSRPAMSKDLILRELRREMGLCTGCGREPGSPFSNGRLRVRCDVCNRKALITTRRYRGVELTRRKGRHSHTNHIDIARIDWSKGTAELARELGATRIWVSLKRRKHAPETLRPYVRRLKGPRKTYKPRATRKE